MAKNVNKWNENDIREIFDRLDEEMGVDSKNVPIKVNNRLKRSIARYRWYNDENHTACDFEFGKYIMNVEDKKALEDVAIHEWVHWYLETYKKLKEGHSPLFRKIVKQLGSDNVKSTCTDFVQKQFCEARQRIEGNQNIIGGKSKYKPSTDVEFYKWIKKEFEKQNK